MVCNCGMHGSYEWIPTNVQPDAVAAELAGRVCYPPFFLCGVFVNSLQQRRLSLILVGSLVGLSGLSGQAQAASAPALQLGLWSSEYRVLLNGVDSSVLVQKVNADIVKMLPANMQADATAAFDSARTRGNTKTCMNSQNAAMGRTPLAIFANFAMMNPLCSLTPTAAWDNQLSFTGRCNDPQSYVGPVTGRLLVTSAQLWSVDFNGVGKVPAAAVSALGLAPGTAVTMRSFSASRWTSATCK